MIGTLNGQCQEKPVGDIRSAINELKVECKELDGQMARLYELISPVVSQIGDDASKACQPCSPSSTSLGGELRGIISDVVRIKLLVRLICERVSI